jgi:hypothetical protein
MKHSPSMKEVSHREPPGSCLFLVDHAPLGNSRVGFELSTINNDPPASALKILNLQPSRFGTCFASQRNEGVKFRCYGVFTRHVLKQLSHSVRPGLREATR